MVENVEITRTSWSQDRWAVYKMAGEERKSWWWWWCLCVSDLHLISSLSHHNSYLLKTDSKMSQEMASGLGRRLVCALSVQVQPMHVHPIRERPEPGIWLAGESSLELFSNGLKGQESPEITGLWKQLLASREQDLGDGQKTLTSQEGG